MKILAYADTHGSSHALKNVVSLIKRFKPDIAICAGDISIFGNNLERILDKIDSFGVLTLMIHGNHESEDSMKAICTRYKHIMFIHKKAVIVDDVLVMGYGGGGFSLKDPHFVEISKTWRSKMKKAKASVLVTHAPPYDTVLDHIMEEPCGNKDIRNFIVDAKPDVALCGHLHENNGKSQKLGKTRMFNPGPNGKIIIV